MSESVIGIIGHRDLCPHDEGKIKESIRRWVEMQRTRDKLEEKPLGLP